MYSKNVIAVTAALMLGQAAAYPAQLIDRDNQDDGPWSITDHSPSCKYDPRLGWIGTYCTGGKQNGVYGYGVRLEDNPAYYTYNDGDIQRGHSDKGYFSKTADGKYTVDWSRGQIAETGEKLDPWVYNPYLGVYKRDVAESGRRQSRARNVQQNEIEARAAAINSDNNLATRDDQAQQDIQAQQEANAQHANDALSILQEMHENHQNNIPNTMTEEQARQAYPWAFDLSVSNAAYYIPSANPYFVPGSTSYFVPGTTSYWGGGGVSFLPKDYGFGSGSNEHGTYTNLGLYQIGKSEYGNFFKGPGYNVNLDNGQITTDYNKLTPVVW